MQNIKKIKIMDNDQGIKIIKLMLDNLRNGKKVTYQFTDENGKEKDVVIDDPKEQKEEIKRFVDQLDY